jgi:hypothetical protein
MEISTQQRIELEHLLLQREGAYARVHQAEAEITKIFGEEYPLPPPPEDVVTGPIPKKKARKSRATAKKKAVPKIRPLDEDESAYRIGFLQEGSEVSEIHVDRKAIQNLFKTGAAAQIVLWVDVLDEAEDIAERIYERE